MEKVRVWVVHLIVFLEKPISTRPNRSHTERRLSDVLKQKSAPPLLASLVDSSWYSSGREKKEASKFHWAYHPLWSIFQAG